MIEQALMLGPRRAIVGVITKPDESNEINKTAVLILNAGLIHHAGPGRLHVKLARRLAEVGVSSVRFDLSGIGDSPVRVDNLPVLEVATLEPQEVMNDLSRKGYENFILVGICSGAFCAFKTALKDQRVISAVMINTMDLTGTLEVDSRVREQRYFKKSLFSLRAWVHLVTGKINYGHLFSTILSRFVTGKSEQTNSQLLSEFQTISQNRQRLLFVFSEQDVMLNYLEVLLGSKLGQLKRSGTIVQEIVPKADHIFSRNIDQNKLLEVITEWVERLPSNANDNDSVCYEEKGV